MCLTGWFWRTYWLLIIKYIVKVREFHNSDVRQQSWLPTNLRARLTKSGNRRRQEYRTQVSTQQQWFHEWTSVLSPLYTKNNAVKECDDVETWESWSGFPLSFDDLAKVLRPANADKLHHFCFLTRERMPHGRTWQCPEQCPSSESISSRVAKPCLSQLSLSTFEYFSNLAYFKLRILFCMPFRGVPPQRNPCPSAPVGS